MDWKLGSLLKGLNVGGGWQTNLVGTLCTKDNEYIFKISRLPLFLAYWEFMISNEIKLQVFASPTDNICR